MPYLGSACCCNVESATGVEVGVFVGRDGIGESWRSSAAGSSVEAVGRTGSDVPEV